jgi:alpha-1,4-digalacturonate transport system substrate-binding protein
MRLKHVLIATGLSISMTPAAWAQQVQLQVMFWNNDVEADVFGTLLERFEVENPDIDILYDVAPYATFTQSLPMRLESGQGPDVFRYTALGELSQYALDIEPYLDDTTNWTENHQLAKSYLNGPNDPASAIKGYMLNLGVTGSFVNKSLFDAAEVPIPGPKASYEDWAEAARQVAETNQIDYAMAVDRSGHRIMPILMAYGAEVLDTDGKPAVVDNGFRAGAKFFQSLFEDGIMAKPVWVELGGAAYADAFEEFKNGQLAVWLSGDWQLGRLDDEVGDAFDWVVAPPPCGPAGCPSMPGGGAVSGNKATQHPAEVARLLDWLAQAEQQEAFAVQSTRLSGHAGLLAEGVAYTFDTQQATAAYDEYQRIAATRITELGTRVLASPYSALIMNTVAARFGQVLAGEMSLDQGFERISSDIAASPLLN